MIVGKEGQPRSGKSYETVKHDVLEALKAKRRVYARINGLSHERIAEYLGEPLEVIQAQLVVMDDDQVHAWLVCDTQADGSLVFPHVDKGSLVIVDEVHEYWPTGRAPIPKPNADFFAKHGHIGLDVVLMTQDFKEVHRSVIRRMQRKNVYTKLDALGKDASYSIRFYTASVAGKFELTGSEKRDYDPAIWPLYHGIQPGVEGNEVYKTGSKTIWQTAKKPAIFMALALLVGLFFLGRFFLGGGAAKPTAKKERAPVAELAAQQSASMPQVRAPAASAPATPVTPVVAPAPKEDVVPPGVRYVLDLASTGRTRYAGAFGDRDMIEFRGNGGGQVLDRFTTEQLWALGWSVIRTGYGALLTAKDQQIIATAWPVDTLGVQSMQTASKIKAAGSPVTSASETQPNSAAAAIGGSVISKEARAQGTFPESPGYEVQTSTPATSLDM